MRIHKLNRGVTLLEVMVAVLVFSVGLLGMAGLMLVSQRTNHSAFLRTQAGFLAQGMIDRMRANPGGVWGGEYDSTGYPESGSLPACTLGSGCDKSNIAKRDRIAWSNAMTDLLPGPKASITCTRSALGIAVPAELMNSGTTYDGTCTMVMTWKESNLNKGSDAADQTFAWVFQP